VRHLQLATHFDAGFDVSSFDVGSIFIVPGVIVARTRYEKTGAKKAGYQSHGCFFNG